MKRFLGQLIPNLILLLVFWAGAVHAEFCPSGGQFYTTSPNMSLNIPTVGVETGPLYASDLNCSLSLIDSHNHTPGSGVQVPSAGLNINADLPFGSSGSQNNATFLRSVRFYPQVSPISGGSDIDALSVSGVDLYYRDGNGNNIRLTAAGAISPVPGVVPISDGGTGQTSASAAFNALNPSGSDGQVLVHDSTAASGASYQNTGVPTGSLMAFVGTTAPTGWDFADGASVATVGTYAKLYAVIGCAYGCADGSHFNKPDMRGRFPRGTDNMGTAAGAAGNDPDASSRTACKTGGNTANNVGSCQGQAFQTHSHGLTGSSGSNKVLISGANTNNGTQAGPDGYLTWAQVISNGYLSVNNASASGTTSQSSSNETRPINVYVNYIIKL